MANEEVKKKTNTTSGKKKTQAKKSSTATKSSTTKKTTTAKKSSTKKTTSTKNGATAKSSTTKKTTPKVKEVKDIKTVAVFPEEETMEEKLVESVKVETIEEMVDKIEIPEDEPTIEKDEIILPAKETKVEEKSTNDKECKTILGLDLPVEDKQKRKTMYKKDALAFAIIVPIIDLFMLLFIKRYKPLIITNNIVLNYIMTLGIDFILIFILTYVIDYIYGEDAIKKIRNK